MWNDNKIIPYDPNQYYEPPPPVLLKHEKGEQLTDGFILPALQALVTGILTGLAALAITAWLEGPYWAAGATAFTLASLYAWLSYRGGWNDRLEAILGIDLNHDHRIGPPPRPPQGPDSVRIELIQDNGNRGDIIDLPYPDRLPAFAQAVLSGRQYSQSVMVGTGKLFSRPEYDTLIDALVAGGLMRWKNPDHHNIGAEPTLAGKAVLKHYVPTPSPTEDD